MDRCVSNFLVFSSAAKTGPVQSLAVHVPVRLCPWPSVGAVLLFNPWWAVRWKAMAHYFTLHLFSFLLPFSDWETSGRLLPSQTCCQCWYPGPTQLLVAKTNGQFSPAIHLPCTLATMNPSLLGLSFPLVFRTPHTACLSSWSVFFSLLCWFPPRLSGNTGIPSGWLSPASAC